MIEELQDNKAEVLPPLPKGYEPVKKSNSTVPPLPSGYNVVSQPKPIETKQDLIPVQKQTNVGVGIVAPKEKPSPYLKGLDFKNVTDAIKADKDKKDSYLGGLYNSVVDVASNIGSGIAYAGALGGASSMGSVGGSKPISSKERLAGAESISKAAADLIESAKSESSSRENEQQRGEFDLSNGVFTGKNLSALAFSLPSQVAGMGAGAMTGGLSFIAQGVGGAAKELAANPNADKLTGEQKLGYIATQATVNAVLEKFALDKIFKSTGITGKVKQKIASEITKELIEKGVKATAKDIENAAIRNATKFLSKSKKVGLKTATAMGVEGSTEGLQSGAEDAVKLLTNYSSGKDVFDVEDIKKNFGKNMLNSAVMGAATGGLLGGGASLLQNTNKAIRNDIAKAQTPEDVARIKQNINEQVELGNITQEEADAAGIKMQQYAEIAAKIPTEVDADKKYAIIGGIEQRESINKKISEEESDLQQIDDAFPEYKQGKKDQIDLLKGKLGQVNDYIESIVSGKNIDYTNKGESYYKVAEDGTKTPISKEHYELATIIKDEEKSNNVTIIKPEENVPKKTIGIGVEEIKPETKKSGVAVILPNQVRKPNVIEKVNEQAQEQTPEILNATKIESPVIAEVGEVIEQPKAKQGQAEKPTVTIPIKLEGREFDANFLTEYKGKKIVEINGDIHVYDPQKETVFNVSLDDSKTSGDKRIVAEANNIESAKKYIDWATKTSEENKKQTPIEIGKAKEQQPIKDEVKAETHRRKNIVDLEEEKTPLNIDEIGEDFIIHRGSEQGGNTGFHSLDEVGASGYGSVIASSKIKKDVKILKLVEGDTENYKDNQKDIEEFYKILGDKEKNKGSEWASGESLADITTRLWNNKSAINKLKKSGIDIVVGETIDGVAVVVVNKDAIETISKTKQKQKEQPKDPRDEYREFMEKLKKEKSIPKVVDTKPTDEYVSKNGKHKIVYDEKGNPKVVDTKTGEQASDYMTKKVINEKADSFDYSKGKRIEEEDLEGKQFKDEQELGRHIVENSENPTQIAEVFAMQKPTGKPLSTVEQFIAEFGIGRVTSKSWKRFGDRNYTAMSLAKSYLDGKRAKGIDEAAREMSDHYGIEITPQDIVDFMVRFPNGTGSAFKLTENEVSHSAKERFQELTGLPLNSETAAKAINYEFNKLNEGQRKFAEQQFKSEKELETAYWREHKATDGFTKESSDTQIEQKKEQVKPTTVEQQYQEIKDIKSKKAQEKAKERLINDNFESIVSQLMLKNKIKRVC